MHLFYKNPNVELFNILQIIRIQSENGEGVQSLVKNLSKKNYGFISARFKEIIGLTEKGDEFAVAIDRVMSVEKNKFFHGLLNVFKLAIEGNVNFNYAINDIEEKILEEQKISFDNYVIHVSKFSTGAFYVLLIPFIYLVLMIINWVATSFFEGGQEILDTNLRMILFIFNAVLLLLAVLMMRFNK